jgi:hypothetical protein
MADKVIIKYREGGRYYGARSQEFTAGPYDMNQARQIVKNLEVMGGYDFAYKPYMGGDNDAVS